jgi:transcriptional regulator with XRE-family HTH domain
MSVKEIRIRGGLTQRDLSYLSRVPISEISRIECGRLKPTNGQLQRLAKALGVKPDQITTVAPEQ